MEGVEPLLDAYGLAAVFVVMLAKSAGVPIPMPADVLMLAVAARVAQGKLGLPQAFAAILVAMVLGGLTQFLLARGPGRDLLYRFGRYLGLSPARLDATAATLKRGGPVGIGLAIVTPGVRAATIAACGLAGLPLRAFVPGLLLGNGLFLSLHFTLGYLGAPLLLGLARSAPGPWIWLLAVLAAGLGAWVVIRRRQRPESPGVEVAAEALAAWHEASCPVCLALGAASRARGSAHRQPMARRLAGDSHSR